MNPEVIKPQGEHNVEVQNAAAEQAEKLRDTQENSAEQAPEHRAERQEQARNDTDALFTQDAGKERASAAIDGSPRAITKVDKLAKKQAFTSTMKHVQGEMSASSRAFSKVIHAPFVEKSSEVLGSSLARPNAILAGSFTALVLVSAVYIVSRTFGYRLSGFETIAAFGFGWVLGIIFDYIKIMVTGKKI